jgi:hypothetical protein
VWLCEVTTGDLQHAGTKSNVYIDVYGENGCVPKVHLNPNQEKFPRNSTVQVSLQLNDDNIGQYMFETYRTRPAPPSTPCLS